MSEADIQQLFTETLRGDYEGDAPWDAVRKLRQLGTREVFDIASRWCSSVDPLMRARGIDVLAQLGKTVEHRTNSFPDESYSVVANVLTGEQDLRPLNSAIVALAHLGDPRAVPLVAEFRSYPNAEIRFAVACALGSFPNDPLSVETLLTLMADTDEKVRDWATFGVGVLGDSDSSTVRDALVRAMNDLNQNVREEALVALAKRHDIPALAPLLAALKQALITDRVIEAACSLLGLNSEPKHWASQDYAKALNEQFSPGDPPLCQ